MSTEETHSGIPTRAIHESYLDMIRSLKEYRQAKDKRHQKAIQDSHGEFQQNLLTLYELLRPHLRSESAVRPYWTGELPPYKGNGTPPLPEDGKGVIQVQQKNDSFGPEDIPRPQEETLEAWHNALSMNGNRRIKGIRTSQNGVFVVWDEYQIGLHHLDNWDTSYKRTVVPKEGFQSDKTEERITRQRIPIDRLENAARELSDAAQKLGALSDFDASEPRTEIPKELIEKIEEWRQNNIND